MPAGGRKLVGLLAAVLLLGACSGSDGSQTSQTALPDTATTPSPESAFPDPLEHDDLLALSGEQLDIFVGMTEEDGRAFAEDHGFILKVAGPGHESVTAEPCLCVYARSDADGVIISVMSP